MTHGYKNIFGEERIRVSLFQTGNVALDAVLTDWFFGSEVVGLSISLSEMLRVEEVMPNEMVSAVLISLSESVIIQDFFYLVDGEYLDSAGLIALAKEHGYISQDNTYELNTAIQVLIGAGYSVTATNKPFDLGLGPIGIIIPAND
jgi:hypothetical protein